MIHSQPVVNAVSKLCLAAAAKRGGELAARLIDYCKQ